MKILLISVNREKMPFPVFPLGLAYIAKVLREDGHPIEVVDLCFSKEVSDDLKSTLHRFQPNLIGISLRNLDNLTYPTSLSYLKGVEEVIEICRQFTSSRLVIGGSGYSLAPKELLQHLDVDFGIVGEGEEIFLQLVRSLEKGDPVSPSPLLLIKEKPFPPWIEGARIFPIRSPDRSFFRNTPLFRRRRDGKYSDEARLPFLLYLLHLPFVRREKGQVEKDGRGGRGNSTPRGGGSGLYLLR